MSKVSIVIPVHNDSVALGKLLEYLPTLDGYGKNLQVLIAASPVDDTLTELARQHDVKLVSCLPGRGVQMNEAAALASGEILWFLHADARPGRSSLSAIRAAIRAGAEGGFLQFVFSGTQSSARTRLARLINWRARNGIAYGDQGLFFRTTSFMELGGFAPEPLFEEVPLVKTMKARGNFVALDEPVIVSARRWESDGWIRRTIQNRLLALGYGIGIAPSTLARWYTSAKRKQQT